MPRPLNLSWKNVAVIVLLAGVALTAAFSAQERAAGFRELYDEYSIILPAVGHLMGDPLPLLHYPEFTYLFYSYV
ncbi:MAG: hypothetical protein ABIJ95_02685, partial [Pseudomonadota bacterium]